MNTATLNERQRKLALHLQKHPAGLKAHEMLNALSDYDSGEDTPDTIRKRLLRDLQKLQQMDLASYEAGRRRHTVWYPGTRKSVELMPVEHAVAITALSLFGELPLDESMSGRVARLIADARLSLRKQGKHYAALREKIAYKPWVGRRKLTSGIRPEIFDTVFDAILREQKISFGYRSSKGNESSRSHVSPLALLTYREIFYLAFYDTSYADPMVWPLHRFQWVETVSGSRITPPEGWNLDAFVRNWSPIPGHADTSPTVVKLRFLNEDAVRNLRDAPLQDCEQSVVPDESSPGTFLFTARLKPNRELLTWILYFGRHVEVLEPESLREAMRLEVEAMRQIYPV